MDNLIVIDHVLGLVDKPSKFSSFLTVCRKFGYNCIYFFYKIYPEKTIWQMIISRTNVFNIFPGSILLSSILKIITNNCNRETISHTLPREHWLNRLYFEISNRNEKVCLTINCRKLNFIQPGKYSYFNHMKNDKVFNTFLAKRISSLNFSFQMDNLVDTSEKEEIKLCKAVTELKDLAEKKDKVTNSNELKERLNTSIQETVMEEEESDLDFFSDNKASQKKKESLERQC